MKHAIASFNFNHLGVVQLLKKAQQLGYDGVEGNYPDLFTVDRGPDHRLYQRSSDAGRSNCRRYS